MAKRRKNKPPKISDKDWASLAETTPRSDSSEIVETSLPKPKAKTSLEDSHEDFAKMLENDSMLYHGLAEKLASESFHRPKPPTPPKTRSRSKKKNSDSGNLRTIDLHGMTLEKAQAAVNELMRRLIEDPKTTKCTLKIITGKGRNSGPDGGVLASHMHGYVYRQFSSWIVSMSEDPAKTGQDGDLPSKGFFDVLLKL